MGRRRPGSPFWQYSVLNKVGKFMGDVQAQLEGLPATNLDSEKSPTKLMSIVFVASEVAPWYARLSYPVATRRWP